MWAIAKRELRALFVAPFAWIVLGVAQTLLGYTFLRLLQAFAQTQGQLQGLPGAPGLTRLVAMPLFETCAFILMLVVPVVTMRLIAEERRGHTLALVLGAPVSGTRIVLGKFAGALTFVLCLVALCALLPIALLMGAALDLWQLAAGLLGLVLVVALFTAAGLFISTLTSQPPLAAAVTFGLLLLLWMLDWGGERASVLQYLSILHHFRALQRGLFDSADIVFFILVSGAFLLLAARRVDALRHGVSWSEGSWKRMPVLGLIRAINLVLFVVVIGLIAWLSTRYHFALDWTSAGRNTLSPASAKLLEALDKPLAVSVFAREDRVHARVIAELLRKYQRAGANLQIEFANPDLNPERMRELGVEQVGAVQLSFNGRTQMVAAPSERTLSNALARLLRARPRIVAYLEGHGERSLAGKANHDLGTFGTQLKAKGLTPQPLNLTRSGAVPGNTDVLLIAAPRVALLPQEVQAIVDYVQADGSLLWLLDPNLPLHGLEPLAQLLGVKREPGTLIDPATQRFKQAGLGNPTFVLVADYEKHPALKGFNLVSVLPGAAGLSMSTQAPWRSTPLLRSRADVWSELGALRGQIRFDKDSERRGPYDLAVAITRTLKEREQRIIIVGDGDFLANSALGNSGNLDLGIRLVNWLAADDVLLDIPSRSDPDNTLSLTTTQTAVIGFGALLILPLILILTGLTVWLRRRNR